MIATLRLKAIKSKEKNIEKKNEEKEKECVLIGEANGHGICKRAKNKQSDYC